VKIVIGADHAGYVIKNHIKEELNSKDISFTDIGTFKEESVDYPEYAYKVANSIINKEADMGILICGTGIGMSIAANKLKGIMAAVVQNKQSATLSRSHNNSNVLCLGARINSKEEILEFVETWINTSHEGGKHQKRIELISKLTGL